MSFFTSNNNVGCSPLDILEQVQPVGEISLPAPPSQLTHAPPRSNEIWVKRSDPIFNGTSSSLKIRIG